MKATWSREDMRRQQSERTAKYAKDHPEEMAERAKKRCKRCGMEFRGETIEFDSRRELEEYLKREYGLSIGRDRLTQYLITGKPYESFFKRKSYMNGMKVYYIQECRD